VVAAVILVLRAELIPGAAAGGDEGAIAFAAQDFAEADAPSAVPSPTPAPLAAAGSPPFLEPIVEMPAPAGAPDPTPPPLVEAVSFAASAPALPDEARIVGIGGRRQSLPLSCESRSAADWAAYFGVEIDELEFLSRLPASDNPDFGFVGDVRGTWGQTPPQPYGVHAGPVATLLRQHGLNAYARRGLAWDDVRAQIAAGRPVIAWVVGHVERGTPIGYTASNGLTTTVARFEHTVIVIGYTADHVTVLDGARIYSRPLDLFLESWAVLGNMAIIRGLLPASN
jgi:uncharacterized protein YvpB